MERSRWMPNAGEIFTGGKPEYIAPIGTEKVLDILLGQLEVLRALTMPPIYIPTESEREDNLNG